MLHAAYGKEELLSVYKASVHPFIQALSGLSPTSTQKTFLFFFVSQTCSSNFL